MGEIGHLAGEAMRGSLVRVAEETLDAALRAVGTSADGSPVERRVVEGPAAHVLVEAADGAELLAVGSRGSGGFRGLLLGSVSQQCAQAAPCPVVIVGDGTDDTPVRPAAAE